MLEQELNIHSVKHMAHYQKLLKRARVIPLALLILVLGVMLPLTVHAEKQERSLCSELKYQSSEIHWHAKNNPQMECVLLPKTIQGSKRYTSLPQEAPKKKTSTTSTGLDTLIFLTSLIML